MSGAQIGATNGAVPEASIAPVRGVSRRGLLHATPAAGIAGLAVVLGVGIGPALSAAEPPQNFVIQEPPQPLPEVKFADDAGRSHSLAEFRGKVVLLNIWATWCIPCRKEMPTLDRLEAEVGGQDFEVVALSIDRGGPEVVKKFYAETKVQHLLLRIDVSGRVLGAFGTTGLPTTLLIDRQGLEFGRLVGPADWAAPETIAFIKSVMSLRTGAATSPQQKERRS